MKEFQSGEDVFNEVGMLRTVFPGTVLLLEGSSDCSVIDNFIDADKCKSIPANGKPNVIDAVGLASKYSIKGVLGIVDADFDRAANRPMPAGDICVTDCHDLEVTILSTGVFSRLARQYCDPQKLSRLLVATKHNSLLDAVLECAATVGYLRWVSLDGIELNFQVLDFGSIVDRSDLRILASDLINQVVSNSRNARASKGDLSAKLAKKSTGRHDLKQIACGHDVAEVMSIALRIVGRCKPEVAEARNVERMWRAAFAASDFIQTKLYAAIKAWEERNTPYRVLNL